MKAECLNITPNGQITLPQSFVTALDFDTEAVCILKDSEIVIRPARKKNDDFSDLILADLIQEGYSGTELLTEFKRRKSMIRPAVERMMEYTVMTYIMTAQMMKSPIALKNLMVKMSS